MKIVIRPIRKDFLLKVREAGLDDQNQKVVRLSAEGGEPCRDVLRRAAPGEALILASYCPFTVAGPYKEYGPVYVLAQESVEPMNHQRFPLPRGLPADYLRQQAFVLRAYNRAEAIVAAELVEPSSAQAVITRMFDGSQAAFILARFAAYGCYGFRIERGDTA